MPGGYYSPNPTDTLTSANWDQYVRDQTINKFASASARDAAITSPTEGMYADLADKNVLTRHDGTAWSFVPFPIVARKTSNQTVVSSTVLVNDSNLAWAVVANAVYLLDMRIQLKADTAGDLKMGWTFPAGLTMLWGYWGAYDTASAFTSNSQLVQTDTAAVGGIGTAVGVTVAVYGVVTVSSTAGTLQYQWAQNASNVNATAVCAGSYGTLTCVA